MRKSIENNILPISLGTLVTVILAVMAMTLSFSSMKHEIIEKLWTYDVRIALLEQQANSDRELFNAMKVEQQETNKNLLNIYKHLTNGE